jgi:predicted ribosomally synthesized peptide with nif11-like leader
VTAIEGLCEEAGWNVGGWAMMVASYTAHSQAMSEEQLKAFMEAVKADVDLQNELKAAGDTDAVVAIAKAAGFVISSGELQRAKEEVSENELERVVGGSTGNSCDACSQMTCAAYQQTGCGGSTAGCVKDC